MYSMITTEYVSETTGNTHTIKRLIHNRTKRIIVGQTLDNTRFRVGPITFVLLPTISPTIVHSDAFWFHGNLIKTGRAFMIWPGFYFCFGPFVKRIMYSKSDLHKFRVLHG